MNSDARIGAILRRAFPEVGSDDPVSYFGREGDVFGALSYAWLFWPRLVEVHGAVFVALDGHDEEDISRRLHEPVGDSHPDWPPLSWIEAVDSFNIFEVEQLFRRWREPREFVVEAQEFLSKTLVEAWHSRLTQRFPERSFAVETLPADDSSGLAIRIHQEHPELAAPAGWDERRRFISVAG